MNSEREKREAEIEKLMRENVVSQESDVAFQEEIRKTASAIVEKEIDRIKRTERAEQTKKSISPMTTGLWLIVLGAAAFTFSPPGLGAVLIVCGILAIVWDTVRKPETSTWRHSLRSIIDGFLKRQRP